MAFHLGGQISTPWIISDTSVFKMATSAQLHPMCYTVCSVLCWWTSWLLFPKTAQTHTSTSYLHMLWSRNEFNTLLSFAPWDFPHCWINFLLIWTDFPRCLCTLARQAHMCLCAGFGGWGRGSDDLLRIQPVFSQLRSVSSIIQENMVAHACRRKASSTQPNIYHDSIISSVWQAK